MAHEYFQELVPSHSLSALNAAEGQELEGHLATCEACRDDLDQWRATASVLALATDAAEPSPTVRERILEQIKQEQRSLSREPGSEPETASGSTTNVVPLGPRASRPRGSFVATGRNIWASVGSLGAIAASLALLALLISVFVLWRENRAVKNELAQLASQMQTTEAELARERETVALLTSSGAHLTELAGTKVASNARATIAYDRNGRALLLAKGLPAAPPGKAYQLWFIVGNQKLPGKLFTTDASGNGSLRDEVPAIARAGAVFAVTLEPSQGVSAPTGEIFLVSGS